MFFQKNFKLLIYGPDMNNVLAKPVEEDEWPEIPRLFDYMSEVMRKSNGIGLAAPQVGCFKQFILIGSRQGDVVGLVNPEIVRLYGKETEVYEDCLSMPPRGSECMVPRLEVVEVEASLAEAPYLRKKLTFRGRMARIVQHELDHLTGTFFVDRVSDRRRKEILERFYNWKAIRRAQIRRENENVHTGTFAISSGQSRLS